MNVNIVAIYHKMKKSMASNSGQRIDALSKQEAIRYVVEKLGEQK